MKTPRAFTLSLLLPSVCFALAAVSVSVKPQTEERDQAAEKLQQVSDQITQVDAQLKRKIEEIRQYQTEIETTERAILKAREQIVETQLTLTQLDTELLKIQAKLSIATEELAAEEQRIKTLLRALFVNRDSNTLKLLLSQENPATLARNLVFHAKVLKQQNIQIDTLVALLSKLDQAQQDLEQNRAQRQQTLAALQGQERTLNQQQLERSNALIKVTQLAESLQLRKQQLEQDQARLQSLIDELDTLAQTSEAIQIEPFASQKGTLAWPTSSKMTTRFNSARNTGIRWQGVRFKNRFDDPVRTIYHGRVVFADWLRGYGLLVIIDHGENYMSLYAHNNSLSVEEGQWVEPNAMIARAGNTGGQEEPGLYFEIRHQGEPQNPANWCR